MGIDWKDKFNWVGATFAVVAFLVVCNLIGTVFGLSKSDWAAWVQAIGSIGAIIAAIFVMKSQSESASRLMIASDRRALQRRTNSVGAIIERANTQAALAADRLQGVGCEKKEPAPDDLNGFERDRAIVLSALEFFFRGEPQFSEIIAIIDEIPVHDLGSRKMVEALFLMRTALKSGEDWLSAAWAKGESVSHITVWNAATVLRMMASTANSLFMEGVFELFAD